MKTFLHCMALMLSVDAATWAASTASDTAADTAYDAGWTNGANGGSGFGAWQLSAGGQGGHFTASSAGNAGGASGNIDTSGRAWGMWSTNGVTEAVRALTGGALTTGQVLAVAIDNGFVATGRSVGFAVQNSAGNNLWEFYFSGGDLYFRSHQAYGVSITPVPYTGNGLSIQFELTAPTSYLVRVQNALGTAYYLTGNLIAQFESTIGRVRFWNYEAGPGSDYDFYLNSLSVSAGTIGVPGSASSYAVVDTAQAISYSASNAIAPPAPGAAFAGQDAQYAGNSMSYTISGDGLTVYDNRTGLTWSRSPDRNNDSFVNYADKLSAAAAATNAQTLNTQNFGGYNDWRLPTIKELYSLMDFRGTDASSFNGSDLSTLRPFIDTNYFRFGYGDTNAGERIIDAQWATRSIYSSTTMTGNETMFGVNFADGRIKGYPASGSMKLYYVYYVRGNTNYGINQLVDNGDGTVLDLATGLQWQQGDNGTGINWQSALAYAEGLKLGGYQDWRLPNAKELQSILDYSRCPDATASPAIDPVFTCSSITNEAGALDYPFYWASTTHVMWPGNGAEGVYLCFGRSMGYFMSAWLDVHGAGAQRSDPKDGNPNDYPQYHGPQGDVQRVFNYVRCVRGGATAPTNDVDGDGLSDWYEYNYTTNTTAMTAGGDLDGDGCPNLAEQRAGTSPIDATSYFGVNAFACDGLASPAVTWRSVLGERYRLQRSTNLTTDASASALATNIAATPPLNVYTDASPGAAAAFYEVLVQGQ